MRRALLLAAVAAPALAVAQTIPAGMVQFVEPGTTNDVLHGQWINAAECASQATTNVVMQWTASAQMPAGGSYQIYAANQDAQSGIECPKTSNSSSGLIANPIGIPIIGALQTVANHVEMVDAFLAAVVQTSCSNTVDVPIYVCVQLRDSTGTSVGFAKGTLTLSVTRPAPPTVLSVTPAGDAALQVSWTPPSGDPPAYDFVVVATAEPPDPRDPAAHHAVTDPFALSYRVSGLVNDVPYAIQVLARSQAGNESAPSPAIVATPVAPGTAIPRPPGSGGGCAAGAASPVALLAVAALLARLRRRAR